MGKKHKINLCKIVETSAILKFSLEGKNTWLPRVKAFKTMTSWKSRKQCFFGLPTFRKHGWETMFPGLPTFGKHG
jgi:hypothetical protein